MEEANAVVVLAGYNLNRWRAALSVVACVSIAGGCAFKKKTVWRPPVVAQPYVVQSIRDDLSAAESRYAGATQMESEGLPLCVDEYFAAAVSAWPVLERELDTHGVTSPRVAALYGSSVAKLLITAQRFDRWDPQRGLDVASGGDVTRVTTSYRDFPWTPDDFQLLLPTGDYEVPNLKHHYHESGLGVPLVVARNTEAPEPFVPKKMVFAATALLRPAPETGEFRLEFHDPLRVSELHVGENRVRLAADISAPFAVEVNKENRQWYENFIQPGATTGIDGLFMIEPYQRGKIPVIFVHGLLSDPETWVGLVNQLRAESDLNDRYQWWAYRYATGEPFFSGAAVLRRQLNEVRAAYDPNRCDPAFSNMVLIGHSMGGLISKLQVTQSGDQIWRAAARQPFESVRASDEVRDRLRDAFYFEPSPDVARVIFMGTPHLGSTWANRPVGRLGSALVQPSPLATAGHAQLVACNPGLFREELQQRFPTSIDLLEPNSPLLNATASLPYSRCVELHSIIGDSNDVISLQPSDGVVTVNSARLLGVASETFVNAKHEALHSDPVAIAEVMRILREDSNTTGRASTAAKMDF